MIFERASGNVFPVAASRFRKVAADAESASGSIRLSQRRKTRHPWRAQRGPSLARYALLQAYAPFASRPAVAFFFTKAAADKSLASPISPTNQTRSHSEPAHPVLHCCTFYLPSSRKFQKKAFAAPDACQPLLSPFSCSQALPHQRCHHNSRHVLLMTESSNMLISYTSKPAYSAG